MKGEIIVESRDEKEVQGKLEAEAEREKLK